MLIAMAVLFGASVICVLADLVKQNKKPKGIEQ
jgi:hypothetical protein